MDRSTVVTLSRAWVAVALVVGLGTIVFGGASLTTLGVVLVILGLIGLMPALRNFVEPTGPEQTGS